MGGVTWGAVCQVELCHTHSTEVNSAICTRQKCRQNMLSERPNLILCVYPTLRRLRIQSITYTLST